MEEYAAEIIRFSELGDYIHMPMKGYSEGMCARLMFALMTSGVYECLAIDEGFGTGDASFFEKAEARLSEFMKATGTLLLASHSTELLRKFCSRGLVFDKGRLVYDGDLENALRAYNG